MRAVALSLAAAAALITVYLALGGASYAPAKVADPCAARDQVRETGFQHIAEGIVMSALDGAACELRVSREELVLAFAGRESLQRFAREQRIDNTKLERLIRSGLARAIDDAQRTGLLSASTAELLHTIARQVPLARLLDVLDLLPSA